MSRISTNLKLSEKTNKMSSGSQTLSSSEVDVFRALNDFVTDLQTAFSSNKPVCLYKALLDRTGLGQAAFVRKHNQAFKKFYELNKDHILKINLKNLEGKISYSDRVFIDIPQLLRSSPDQETQNAICGHLLNIATMIDPESNAEAALQKVTAAISEPGNPMAAMFSAFTGNGNTREMAEEIQSIDPNEMSRVMQQMFNPQTLSKMMGGIQQAMSNPNGLDFGSLMGVVTETMGEIQTKMENGGPSSSEPVD